MANSGGVRQAQASLPSPNDGESPDLNVRSHAAEHAVSARGGPIAAHWDDDPCDPWTRRARPAFLWVMYALILFALPLGLVAAFSPARAEAVAGAIGGYFSALPDSLYALFGTGYLGYTAARQWGKVRGVEG